MAGASGTLRRRRGSQQRRIGAVRCGTYQSGTTPEDNAEAMARGLDTVQGLPRPCIGQIVAPRPRTHARGRGGQCEPATSWSQNTSMRERASVSAPASPADAVVGPD